MTAPTEPITHVPPFTIVTDSRENAPYTFTGLRADSRDGGGPLVVRTLVKALPSGDYSLEGHEDRVAVERKSLDDLYSTLGHSRDRFLREIERLSVMDFACVMVEASWQAVVRSPPTHSRLNPKTVVRTIMAWSVRFPRVHWWMAGTRGYGERMTFQLLARYWREVEDREKADAQPTGNGSTK